VEYGVIVQTKSKGVFDVTISSGSSSSVYSNVRASLVTATTIRMEMNDAVSAYSVVLDKATKQTATSSRNPDRIHVFHHGRRTTLQIPPPRWLKELTDETAAASSGGIRAPMPSLVVDVKVDIGTLIEKGQAVIILESMKMENVLRAHQGGTVKSVNCKKGDMVPEGMELIVIQGN
jgi:3-methylcrotonyl-CoA carboxylase alpha subunit